MADLEKTREEIREDYLASKDAIEVNDEVALAFGKSILSGLITETEFREKTLAARRLNWLKTSGNSLCHRIRLTIGRTGFIPKKERDKVRVLLDELDLFDPIASIASIKETKNGTQQNDQ